jgi:hypothetical protein
MPRVSNLRLTRDAGLQRHDAKRYSTPTTPEATREMKPPSNCANHLCQKAAYRAWSACVCSQTRIFAYLVYSTCPNAFMISLVSGRSYIQR